MYRDTFHAIRIAIHFARIAILLLLLNACVRVADVMIFTFVSLMPVHNVCRMYDHKTVSLKYII